MALDYLQKLGKAREMVSNIAKTPVGQVVQEFAQTSIDKMKGYAPKATGTLSQSLTYTFTQENGKIDLEFLADDYWDFINSGVDGTAQSSGAISNKFGSTYSFASMAKTSSGAGLNFKESISLWMISKGITAEDGDQESLAYVIMQSVKRKGIKPTEFVNKVLNEEALKQLESEVADAFVKMV